MTTIDLDKTLSAIGAEPELPGDMPDEMWAAFQAVKDDREAVTQFMRVTVKQTKIGIIRRVLDLPKTCHP